MTNTRAVTADLTNELARLLSFTASVATAIRRYSAYNPDGVHENAPIDLMFLADSLHNFDRLGDAILSPYPENIVSACDALLSTYERYQVVNPEWGERQGKYTFDRNFPLVQLDEGIAIFKAIRSKILAHNGTKDNPQEEEGGRLTIEDCPELKLK